MEQQLGISAAQLWRSILADELGARAAFAVGLTWQMLIQAAVDEAKNTNHGKA